jgi:hypothetical protein
MVGPHGFSNRFNEYNFIENGLWDYHMIDENGKEYHNQTEVQFKMNFEDEVVYNALKDFVPEKNEENFDRLETILNSL